MSLAWEEIEKVSDEGVYCALQYLKEGKRPQPVIRHEPSPTSYFIAGSVILFLCGLVSLLFWLEVN